MPRPLKAGLDHFPLDVHMADSHRIMDLLDAFGTDGAFTCISVLSLIYENGGFLSVPGRRFAQRICKKVGLSDIAPIKKKSSLTRLSSAAMQPFRREKK